MRRMWTKEHRERQKAFERRRYPTDLTDEEWERISPILPRPARRRRRPKVNLREILNALRYLARAGCGWRGEGGYQSVSARHSGRHLKLAYTGPAEPGTVPQTKHWAIPYCLLLRNCALAWVPAEQLALAAVQ
jgi:Putative transposase of IS4/5 family (DUF4096)